MSRLSSTYSGRPVDLLSAAGTQDQRQQKLDLVFGEGAAIAGVQQVLQAFVATLLTDSTSSVGGVGTLFWHYLLTRNPRTAAQVKNFFVLAASDAIAAINTDATLADERIAEVALLGSVVESAQIQLRIGLTTEAGTGASVLVPVQRGGV